MNLYVVLESRTNNINLMTSYHIKEISLESLTQTKFTTGHSPSSLVRMGSKTERKQIPTANHSIRGANTVYKPVANAIVVAMYANHISFFVKDL